MRPVDRILELLYDRQEGYWSLEELAAAAGVDRPGLDGHLTECRRRGQRIDYSPSNGVRLLRPIRLVAGLIERRLRGLRVGRQVLCFEEVGSTNDVALDATREQGADGLVVLAEWQRSGRGRHGRKWISPPGRNILLSAVLVQRLCRHDALTIATGLAVAEGIEDAAHLPCELRWPNDVLVEGAKVAGVLVEMRRGGGGFSIVLGVGINVNAAPAPEEVEAPATCLAEHLGQPAERTEIVCAVLLRLNEWLERIGSSRLAALHDGFLARCRMINRRATVLCDGRRHTGLVLDVDPLRGLVLCRDDGSRAHMPAERATLVAGTDRPG
jgi:BirA family biotin operon repressor/biotin-[acetyl-CoA-carboxylase] ligase